MFRTMTDTTLPFDEARFRQVLGHFTTGVTVVTAAAADGPVGLAVGSFASVSLDPPLVGFFPDKSSSSWPKIEPTGHFCVNVLAEAQEDVCRRFAGKGDDKFRGLGWRPASSGAPVLDGILAWIDCDIAGVTDAGDHYFVLGRVRDLAVAHDGAPLLFFRGGYGRFAV
jgi:flavin reductase (DIM6/NTAB) family NADH-FMN oxidoreductase RutF